MIDTPQIEAPLNVPLEKRRVFQDALSALEGTIPFAIGGALALYFHTGIKRDVHDFDVHITPADVQPALDALAAAGFEGEVHHPQWLAQAWKNDVQVDMVFGQGSWHDSVRRSWIERGPRTQFLGHEVTVLPPEELLYSKAMRCARIRHDSADLFHILVGTGERMDWQHLLDLFGPDWEVLLSHLIMFRYVFPSHAGVIPDEIMDDLLARLQQERARPYQGPPMTRGMMLDSSGAYRQYVEEWGYVDERQRRWQELVEREPVHKELIRLANERLEH